MPKVERSRKWQGGGNEIWLGDCLDVLPLLGNSTVDAVITDPPYSSGTRREGAKGIRKSMLRETEDEEWFPNDCLTTDGFWWLVHASAVQWKRVLKVGSHILAFIDWRMWPHMSGAIEAADLRRFGMLVWDKTYFGMGSFFRNQHELIMHFTHGRGKEASRHDVANVLKCKPVRNGDHHTEKPVELVEELLSVVTKPGDTVLDPFCGSGSVGVACARTGRRFVGIELEESYWNIAVGKMLSEAR